MKDIFCAAEAWNAVKLCLKKTWRSLSDITYEEDPTQNVRAEDENSSV